MLFRLLSALSVVYVFIASRKQYTDFLSFCPLLNVLSAVFNVRNIELMKEKKKKNPVPYECCW